MKKWVNVLLLCCGPLLLQAQAGLRTYSVEKVDILSCISNPAALGHLQRSSAGLSIERKFLLPELGNYEAALGIVTGSGTFGLSTGYSGFSEYNTIQAGLAYGRKVGTKLSAGIGFDYLSNNAGSYGHSADLTVEAGLIMHLSGKFHSGMCIQQAVRSLASGQSSQAGINRYSFGLGYDVSSNFFATMQMIKEEDLPTTVDISLQYFILPSVVTSIGLSSATAAVSFAVGVYWNLLRVDFRAAYHPQLGPTPGVSIIFNTPAK